MSTKDLMPTLRSTTASQKRSALDRIEFASKMGGQIIGVADALPAASRMPDVTTATEKSVKRHFSMPPADAQLLDDLLRRARTQGLDVCGASGLVRAAIRHLADANTDDLARAVAGVIPSKHARK